MPSTECTVTMLPRCASIIDGTKARVTAKTWRRLMSYFCCHESGVDAVERHQWAIVADVVDQDVDPTVFGEHGIGKPGDIVVGGDIDDMAADGSARLVDLVADAVGTFPVDFSDLDERSVLGEQSGDARADAVAAAGDDRDPAVEKPTPVVDTRDISHRSWRRTLAALFDLAGHIAYRGPDRTDVRGVETAERRCGDRHRRPHRRSP